MEWMTCQRIWLIEYNWLTIYNPVILKKNVPNIQSIFNWLRQHIEASINVKVVDTTDRNNSTCVMPDTKKQGMTNAGFEVSVLALGRVPIQPRNGHNSKTQNRAHSTHRPGKQSWGPWYCMCNALHTPHNICWLAWPLRSAKEGPISHPCFNSGCVGRPETMAAAATMSKSKAFIIVYVIYRPSRGTWTRQYTLQN